MLGHKMFQVMSAQFEDTWCTIRSRPDRLPWSRIELLHSARVIGQVDAANLANVERVVTDLRPDVIINCLGTIKQREAALDPVTCITLNSLLPHRLAAAASAWGGRIIHFSTDCVFSGRKGGYTEDDPRDAEDLYGQSKALGETVAPNALTLRTSIIGRELHHHHSLLDWLLAQKQRTIRGFTRVWWSGVTTIHLAEFVADVITRYPGLTGLFQVSSGKISKYDLLIRLRDGLELDVDIRPDDTPACDRSLNGERLRHATGYLAPSWDTLLAQLKNDATPYNRWVSL
jgi:dTDP-4-dehydrorhamnose reductase